MPDQFSKDEPTDAEQQAYKWLKHINITLLIGSLLMIAWAFWGR